MNNIVISGRIVKDPKVIHMDDEKRIANFSIAVKGIKKDEVDFFDAVAFGKEAEVLEKYVKKGNRILLRGRLQQYSYKRNDETVKGIRIVVGNLELIDYNER